MHVATKNQKIYEENQQTKKRPKKKKKGANKQLTSWEAERV